MVVYPVIRLGQAQPVSAPLQTSAPSSFLTNPQGMVSSGIAKVEDVIAAKLKDQNFKTMLIAGGVGLLAGLVLFPLGQSLLGYSVVKKSDLPPQDYAY